MEENEGLNWKKILIGSAFGLAAGLAAGLLILL